MKVRLVPNWRRLWRAASVQAIAFGILAPEILQLIADNSQLIPWLTPEMKSATRLVCMVLAVLLRPIQQESVSGSKGTP